MFFKGSLNFRKNVRRCEIYFSVLSFGYINIYIYCKIIPEALNSFKIHFPGDLQFALLDPSLNILINLLFTPLYYYYYCCYHYYSVLTRAYAKYESVNAINFYIELNVIGA